MTFASRDGDQEKQAVKKEAEESECAAADDPNFSQNGNDLQERRPYTVGRIHKKGQAWG